MPPILFILLACFLGALLGGSIIYWWILRTQAADTEADAYEDDEALEEWDEWDEWEDDEERLAPSEDAPSWGARLIARLRTLTHSHRPDFPQPQPTKPAVLPLRIKPVAETPLYVQEKPLPIEPEFDVASHLTLTQEVTDSKAKDSRLNDAALNSIRTFTPQRIQERPLAQEVDASHEDPAQDLQPLRSSDLRSEAAPTAVEETASSYESEVTRVREDSMAEWIQGLRATREAVSNSTHNTNALPPIFRGNAQD